MKIFEISREINVSVERIKRRSSLEVFCRGEFSCWYSLTLLVVFGEKGYRRSMFFVWF